MDAQEYSIKIKFMKLSNIINKMDTGHPIIKRHSQPNSINNNANQKKQIFAEVYQQLCTQFQKQSSKIKFNPLIDLPNSIKQDQKINKVFKKQNKLQKSFSTEKVQIIAMPHNSLPRLRQVTNSQKKRIKLGKFMAEKLIVNQTIYIHEKRRFQKLESADQFKQNGKSILSQRSKRLTFLHKKQAQENFNSVKSKNLDSAQINNKILNLNPQQTSIQFKKNRLIETILKVQQKRNKIQKTYKQVERSKKKLLTNAFKDHMMGDTVHLPEASLTVKKPRHHSKVVVSAQQFSIQKKPFVKKFNWKKQHFPLNKIEKGEFIKLLRKYLHVSNVSPPSLGFYKIYVGQGNNSQLIKQCLKSKGYWIIVDSLAQKPNLVWTQIFQQQAHSSTFKGQQVKVNQNRMSFGHLSHQQLQNFVKFKSNQYIQGIKKLFSEDQFKAMMSQIIRRFKKGLAVGSYSQIQKFLVSVYSFKQSSHTCFQQNTIKSTELRICNHIQNSPSIGNKKGLYQTLQKYCQLSGEDIQNLVPTTVHIQFKQFDELDSEYILNTKIQSGPWILKPGQDTNRGRGISIHTNKQSLLSQIKKRQKLNQQQKSLIVQKYIQPFLYNNRKFDIRVWVLWSKNKLWWYKEGYIRTSCKEFNLKNTNKFIHLTNDAVQNTCDQYGKYQPANKLSFNQFQKYLDAHHNSLNFNTVHQEMKVLTKKLFKMSSKTMNQNSLNFELFGLDFLIDSNFKVWLIEANTNPCLDICCSLLSRLIPNMVQNMMQIVVDPLFPCPQKRIGKQSLSSSWNCQNFKFQLLYNGDQDGQQLSTKILQKKRSPIQISEFSNSQHIEKLHVQKTITE